MSFPTPRRRGHRLPQMPHAEHGVSHGMALGNEPQPERLPEHALLIAILWQAITDATRPTQELWDARAFLQSTERLAWFCEPLGLNATWLQQGLQRRWPAIWRKRESEE